MCKPKAERIWWRWRRRRGAAVGSCGEELGAHDRGGLRSGGAAVQDKGQGQSLTSQVHPAAMQPAAFIKEKCRKVGIQFESCFCPANAYHRRTQCVPYEYHAYHMRTICVPHAYHMRTTCVPLAYHLRIICIPDAYHELTCVPSVVIRIMR